MEAALTMSWARLQKRTHDNHRASDGQEEIEGLFESSHGVSHITHHEGAAERWAVTGHKSTSDNYGTPSNITQTCSIDRWGKIVCPEHAGALAPTLFPMKTPLAFLIAFACLFAPLATTWAQAVAPKTSEAKESAALRQAYWEAAQHVVGPVIARYIEGLESLKASFARGANLSAALTVVRRR